MTAKHHRILGFVCCIMAALIAVLNLQRTANLGMKTTPILLVVLGALQFNRARKKERQTL
jgi:hypothetical protein